MIVVKVGVRRVGRVRCPANDGANGEGEGRGQADDAVAAAPVVDHAPAAAAERVGELIVA